MTNHKHTYDHGDQSKKKAPTASRTEKKADNESECFQSKNKPDCAKRLWGLTKAEWTMAILTLLGIVIALLTGLIFYLQLDEMRIDERAWIGVHIDPVKLAVNEVPGGKLQVANIGKTPAKRVVVLSIIEVIKSTEAPDFGSPTKISHVLHKAYLGDLYPNDHTDIDLPRNDVNSVNIPLTSTEYSDLIGGQSYVAIYGHVWYQDVFKKQHDRVFCYWFPYGPSGSQYTTGTCTEHNTEDDPKR
jgi:hypothetical protein